MSRQSHDFGEHPDSRDSRAGTPSRRLKRATCHLAPRPATQHHPPTTGRAVPGPQTVTPAEPERPSLNRTHAIPPKRRAGSVRHAPAPSAPAASSAIARRRLRTTPPQRIPRQTGPRQSRAYSCLAGPVSVVRYEDLPIPVLHRPVSPQRSISTHPYDPAWLPELAADEWRPSRIESPRRLSRCRGSREPGYGAPPISWSQA